MNTSKNIVKIAVEALEEKKAAEVTVIDISNVTCIADYFVIANGENSNQVQALIDNVTEKLGKAGYNYDHIEGYNAAHWVLADYKDVVIHVFSKEDRRFYDIERIWRDGKFVNVDEL